MLYWVKKIHKWASLVIGVQLLIWVTSGLLFNVIDHNKASGNGYRQALDKPIETINPKNLFPVEQVLAHYPDTVALKSITLLGQPYYLLTKEKGLYRHFKNRYQLVNAQNGELRVIDENIARSIANASYNGPGSVSSITLVQPPISDFAKQHNPSWRINYSDSVNTSAYVEQGSGRLVGHSNDDRRFADLLFMLHFMDYGSSGSFNNIQIMLFAFVTLWLALSGFIWTLHMLSRGKYKLNR